MLPLVQEVFTAKFINPKDSITGSYPDVQLHFFFIHKVTNMQAQRTNALTNLKLLVEELQYGGIALSDTKLVEVFDQIFVWANNEGDKSCLPEIYKRIDDIKLKVRDHLNLLCISIQIIH